MLAEVLGERALVVESVVDRDFADATVSSPEVVACCLDACLNEKARRICSENFAKATIELPDRHTTHLRQS